MTALVTAWRPPRPCRAGRPSERGAASVAVAGIVAVILALLLLAVDAARLLAAAGRAETAADAAALAAAQELAFPSDAAPAAEAERFAEANGADLVTCHCEPGSSEAVVMVRIDVGGLFVLTDRRLHRLARAVVDLPG